MNNFSRNAQIPAKLTLPALYVIRRSRRTHLCRYLRLQFQICLKNNIPALEEIGKMEATNQLATSHGISIILPNRQLIDR